jgi:hypothetical protein
MLNKQFLSELMYLNPLHYAVLTLNAVDIRAKVFCKSPAGYIFLHLLVQDCSHEEVRHAVRNCSGIYMTCFDRKSVIAMSRRGQGGTETQLLVPPSSRTAIFVYPS